ncbi:glycosyltransferase family 2 protein [Streptomyces sp. NPDC003077]|uniref:glycosyltransferase family 2 protein n=1 Tax=Streptomyces sp. NPDC003077 TaxID=3154443 RepID=UPI0033A6AC52
MSAYRRPAAPAVSPPDVAPEFPRHVVTAVLVAHDGARWLPDALAGLLGQERPVQNAIAADTGSADDSARLLAEALGEDRVLHLARRSGFGTAVDEAVRAAGTLTPDDLPYLKRPSGWDPITRAWRDDAYDLPEFPHGEPVQWLWLLHDDCAPEPGALAALLRVADADSGAAVVGPKLRSWYDRRQLLEVGVGITRGGRRWTGLDRREQDQGQHDQVRAVLSVSSAGMLVRRDVYERLGGFDRRLPLMRDDVDLCWRAQAAGHQVLVAPEAVLRHVEASARERRPIDCAGRAARPGTKGRSLRGPTPHRVDKSAAVHTLLANTRGPLLLYVLPRLVLGTLLRASGYLVGKAPGQALDELAGLMGVLLRPSRILAARRSRGRPTVAASELRPLFPPPGATLRAAVEQLAGDLGGRSAPDAGSTGRHGAVESGPGGEDADFLEVEQFARLKRIARRPAPALFLVLLLVTLVACRGLLGPGTLAGGALLPAPGGLSDLWATYLDNWHGVGIGGSTSAPPYLAILAAVATALFGSPNLAVTVLMVCSVPLAGLTAYFTSRPLVSSRLLRAWGSTAYALLPATTGALADGRIGTAVLAIVLPLMARAAVATAGLRLPLGGRPGWQAVWAYTLLLTGTTAFTPIVWPMAAVLGAAVLGGRALYGRKTGVDARLSPHGLRFLAVVGTPLLVLAPWSLSLLTHPSRFFLEAGQSQDVGTASALDLLVISPGGPKGGGSPLLLGLVLVALAATLRAERRLAVRTAWLVALTGLLAAALTNGFGWAGPAALVYGLALLCAVAVGAEDIRSRMTALGFGWRQPAAALLALLSALAPLYAALSWMSTGADGPLRRRDPIQVPAFVAEESGTPDQPRTLVLDGAPGRVSYTLVRGPGVRLGDADLATRTGQDQRLNDIVAHLVAGSGADQTGQLGGYAVRYVLVRDGAPRATGRVLDTTPGLTRLSQEGGSALWRVDRRISRVTIETGVPGGGARNDSEAIPVAAEPVEAHTDLPTGPRGRVLRLADAAASGWRATLDGTALKPVTLDGWAQGFVLPEAGGRLDLTYEAPFGHTAWHWAQGLLAGALVVLALPGRRRNVDDDLLEESSITVPTQPVPKEGRRARRLRAAAEVAGEDTPGPEPGVGSAPEGASVPAADPYGEVPTQRTYDEGHGFQDQSVRHAPQGSRGQPTPCESQQPRACTSGADSQAQQYAGQYGNPHATPYGTSYRGAAQSQDAEDAGLVDPTDELFPPSADPYEVAVDQVHAYCPHPYSYGDRHPQSPHDGDTAHPGSSPEPRRDGSAQR